jgi:hypothetical protein
VSGRGREGAEAACRPAPRPVTQGMKVFTTQRGGSRRAEGGDGVPADQPPARLPDLRPGRRVPVAGPGRGLRQHRPRATRKRSAWSSTRTSAR